MIQEAAQQGPLGGEIAAEAVALIGVAHRGAQQRRIPRLGDVADDAAAIERRDHRRDVGVAGEQYGLRLVEAARLGQQRVAGHAGHALVGDDDRDVRVGAEDVERLFGLGRGEHPVLVLEQVLQSDQDVRLVIDGQNRAFAHTGAGCLGIPMTKLAPPPGAVSTISEPLCA